MGGQASARDSAEQKIGEATGQAKDAAGQATEKARKSLQEQVDRRSTEAGEQVGSTARDIRSVADQLRSQNKEKPAQYAEQAANQVERVGGYLRDSDADKFLRDIEDFGRRQPWAVVAGGLALGFIASRFLKASSRRRYEESRPSSRQQLGDGAAPRPEPVPPGAGGVVTPDPLATGPVGGEPRA
jgi:vacuolar-type H+-ATPase subunit H